MNMPSSPEETLILVDAQDRAIGTGLKMPVHREGLLHRAFSIFVFNARGELMLQQRATGKYHSGGLWTNTCCGHPRPGESTLSAARRRLQEEMGFTCSLYAAGTLTYRAQVSNDLIEHEFDHLYVGRFDSPPHPDPAEAQDWKWVETSVLAAQLTHQPHAFTAWFHAILEQPGAHLDTLKARALAGLPDNNTP